VACWCHRGWAAVVPPAARPPRRQNCRHRTIPLLLIYPSQRRRAVAVAARSAMVAAYT